MRDIISIAETRQCVANWKKSGERIAFVPTMGNLHAGHIHLVEQARRHAARVIVSIFVNPLQFNDPDDYARYPRTLEDDRRKLAAAGVDVLFLPSAGEMYPPGEITRVHVPGLSEMLCGAFRPGHFVGMSTVVCKLFNIVQPDVALFGLKDYQQFKIIQRMVTDLELPIELIGVETVREPGGLAMSSRNNYLSADERARASALYHTLCTARDRIVNGDREFRSIESAAMQSLSADGFRPEYFSVRSAETLAEADSTTRQFVVLAAAWLGKARLIDNLVVANA